ncbi:MAG: glycosyltransferase family 4 protein [Pikeienuella sp.]
MPLPITKAICDPMKWSFAIPGDPATPTGGYVYDARVVEASGGALCALRLPDAFPNPDEDDLATTSRLLSEAGPAVIDGLAYGALPAEMIRALPHQPVALCHHPLGLETGHSPETAARLITNEREALSLARHVIVTSDATKRILLNDFGLPDRGVTVAVPGIDRAPPATGGHPPTLLTVASLTRRKGHDVLIRALAKITHLEWRAIWVGPDDRDAEWAGHIRKMIADANLNNRIEIRGSVSAEDLAKTYEAADIFVLPSRYEGYGMVFDEAMMRALPIVACATGAVPDVVPSGAGMLAPPDDPAALALWIKMFLVNRQRRAAMGGHARNHALTLPGWDDTWETIKRVLEGKK